MNTLDDWFPPAGPCAFCGHPDKRHRLWDAIIGHHAAGDSAESIAASFGYPIEAVNAVLDATELREERG